MLIWLISLIVWVIVLAIVLIGLWALIRSVSNELDYYKRHLGERIDTLSERLYQLETYLKVEFRKQYQQKSKRT